VKGSNRRGIIATPRSARSANISGCVPILQYDYERLIPHIFLFILVHFSYLLPFIGMKFFYTLRFILNYNFFIRLSLWLRVHCYLLISSPVFISTRNRYSYEMICIHSTLYTICVFIPVMLFS